MACVLKIDVNIRLTVLWFIKDTLNLSKVKNTFTYNVTKDTD